MDAVDLVLTRFAADGSMQDLLTHSEAFPQALAQQIRELRSALDDSNGSIGLAETAFNKSVGGTHALSQLHDNYLECVSEGVEALLRKAQSLNIVNSKGEIDIVGFHGQTCGHCPPSIARKKSTTPYTIQLGDGQKLADRIGITVAYDFRSDDIMAGGEGAPLAPVHHQHLAEDTKKRGYFPIAFVNGGNTANLSVISCESNSGASRVMGWDAGPFNHFPDMLARQEGNATHDKNGAIGAQGKVNTALLRLLFDGAAITSDGRNFFTLPPPKSSDPQWYRFPPELAGQAPVGGEPLGLPDRMRTAEYLAAYAVMFSLTLLPDQLVLPKHFGLCGGGWENPVIAEHFRGLLHGRFDLNPVLPEHQAAFRRVSDVLKGSVQCRPSLDYGFDGGAMEARIFADAAVCLVKGIPFTLPSTTGVQAPCVCGVLRYPDGDMHRASAALQQVIAASRRDPSQSSHRFIDTRFNRAIPGWR